MTLDSWLKSIPIGERAEIILAIAKACDVTPPAVRHWRNGTRRIPAERCAKLEELSGNKVTRAELRPDIWGDEQKAA